MNVTRGQVEEYILTKLVELSQDWDSDSEIGESALIFSQLGFESLDAVVLGVAIQEHFGQPLPFSELLAELGEQRRDLSVGELIDFVHRNLTQTLAEARSA